MNILYLAPISFGYLKQRLQYIAEELAKKHQVYYVGPTVSFLTHIRDAGMDYRGCSRQICESLQELRLSGMFCLPYRLKIFDLLRLSARYEAAQLKRMHVKFDLIWVGYAGWYDLAKRFRVPIVYDLMDDSVLLTPDGLTRAYIAWAERQIRKEAQIIFASARQLYEQARKRRGHVYLLPNALPDSYKGNFMLPDKKFHDEKLLDKKFHDKEFHDKKLHDKKFLDKGLPGKDIPRKEVPRRYLYVGTIAEWFDYDSVAWIAEHEDCTVKLVGPVRGKKICRENVVYVGQVPKEDVAAYIRESDVCLYPFRGKELLDTVNPMKIYEYLAFNKPVIARRSKETEQLADHIYLYSNKKELQDILHAELKPPFASAEAYSRFIDHNTWSYRGRRLSNILSKHCFQADVMKGCPGDKSMEG